MRKTVYMYNYITFKIIQKLLLKLLLKQLALKRYFIMTFSCYIATHIIFLFMYNNLICLFIKIYSSFAAESCSNISPVSYSYSNLWSECSPKRSLPPQNLSYVLQPHDLYSHHDETELKDSPDAFSSLPMELSTFPRKEN